MGVGGLCPPEEYNGIALVMGALPLRLTIFHHSGTTFVK